MKKKPTLKSVKNRAWKTLSEYVRRKDADVGGTTYCYTCELPIHWKYEAQAGHAIPGRHNAVLLDEEIIRPQCYRCNCARGGMHHVFATKLIKENGLEWWEKKLLGAREIVKLGREDFELRIAEYKNKISTLGAA